MKKQTQTSLISMIISLLLIGNPVLANRHDPHHSYLFNIQVNDPTYGKLNGNYVLTMDVLDDNNNVIWTSQENALFMQGISEFSFTDDSFIKNGASSLRVTIPEIDHTDTLSLTAVPYATHAKHAKNVHFNNVEDMPSSILFFKDNVASISDSNTKELTIHNKSKNNNTASSLSLRSDNGDNFVSISSLKNNQGQLKTQINSKDDIEFYRDGKLVLKLGEDNFQMNGYSSLTATDIANMGFLHSETQVDEFVNNNGYLKSTDMSSYILDNDSRLSDARTPYVSSQLNGDLLYYEDGWKRLAKGENNQILTIESGYPVWKNKVILSDSDIAEMGYIKTDTNTQLTESQVDSYVANNGYALASDSRFSDARTPLIASQTNGDLIYYKDGWKRLPKGNDNQILSIESGYPTWKDASGSVSNSVSQAGYVPAGQGYGNSFYATDSTGVPAWRPISSSLIGLPNVQNINVQESWNMNDNQILGLETISAVNNNGITIKDNDDKKTLEIYDDGDIKVYNSFDVVGSTTLSSLDLSQALDGDDVESASLTQQGAVQLSNAFDGTSESKATTEKALKDGLATKQGADSDLSDLADGSLTGSKIGSGINASNITTGTLSSSRLDSDLQDLADGSLSGSKIGSGVKASNITTGSLSSSRLDSDLQDLADGSLSGSKVGTGISGSNITTGTVATERLDQKAQTVIRAGSNTSSPFPVKAFATINSDGTKQSGYYNVSSTSRTQVTFSSAMSNSNYTVILSLQNPYDIDQAYNSDKSFDIEVYVGTKTTTGFSYSCRIVRDDNENSSRDTIYYKSCSFMVLSN